MGPSSNKPSLKANPSAVSDTPSAVAAPSLANDSSSKKADRPITKTRAMKTKETRPKPPLFRSQSLSSPLNPRFEASHHINTSSNISNLHHVFSGASPIAPLSPTSGSSNLLQGSAQVQRKPLTRQIDPLIRKPSQGRFSAKPGSISSGSTASTPSSPLSSIQIPSSSLTAHWHHHHAAHHHPSSLSSSISPATQSMINEQLKNRYKAQEKAYIKKMTNDYTDDYATMAINTNYDRLAINESDSEGSDADAGASADFYEDAEEQEEGEEGEEGLEEEEEGEEEGEKEDADEDREQAMQDSDVDAYYRESAQQTGAGSIQPYWNNFNDDYKEVNEPDLKLARSATLPAEVPEDVLDGGNEQLTTLKEFLMQRKDSFSLSRASSDLGPSKAGINNVNNINNQQTNVFDIDPIAPVPVRPNGAGTQFGLEDNKLDSSYALKYAESATEQSQYRVSQEIDDITQQQQELQEQQQQQQQEQQQEQQQQQQQQPDNDEFKKIFGDADAEEEDTNIGYASEIARIATNDINDAFQIDDNLIYPLIQPKLKPELLDDENFLERFEWQLMLGVVIKSDIVTAEKNKMIKKLNFGADEENINMMNAHGSEAYLSSFFINQYKENLWLSLKAKKYSRDILEQKRILGYSRSLMDEVIEEVLNYRFNKEQAENNFYAMLIEEGHFGNEINLSVLEKEDYKKFFKLTQQQQHQLDTYLYEEASKEVDNLLEKYDGCEQLWITHEEMYIAKPILKSEKFEKRLNALISWKNIISALYFEKEVLIKWFKNDTYYRYNLSSHSSQASVNYPQEFERRHHSSSSNSSLSRPTHFDEPATAVSSAQAAVAATAAPPPPSQAAAVAAAGFPDDLSGGTVENNRQGIHSGTMSPAQNSTTSTRVPPPHAVYDDATETVIIDDAYEDESTAKYSDINELDASCFAENILAYKNLGEVVEKKIFSVINPWSRKAKESYLVSKDMFDEINLPSYLKILLELVKFPSNLIKEVIRLRLYYAKNITQQTLMGIDQTIYDFKVIIKLCFQVKENLFKFLNGVPDINLKDLEIDYKESDKLLLDFIEFLLVLFHRKLLDSSRTSFSFTTYKEPEVLEKEWYFMRNVGYFLEINSGFKLSRNVLFLISKLVERLLNYLDYQLDNPSLESKLKFIKWYTTTFDNFNNVKRNLTKFTNNTLKAVQNGLILHLNFNKDFTIAKILLQFLKKRNHALVTINTTSNLHDILYNKNKSNTESDTNGNNNANGKPAKRNLIIYAFISEELLNCSDRDITGILQGSKLGCDLKKPSLESLKVDVSNTSIKIIEDSYKENNKFDYNEAAVGKDSDLKNNNNSNNNAGLYKVSTKDSSSISLGKSNDSIDKEAAATSIGSNSISFEDARAKVGYMIILPVVRPINWEGKVRNIELPESELSVFPKLSAARYGTAFLATQGSSFNLPASKANFINNLKKYYVSETDLGSELLGDSKAPRSSVDYAVKLFDKLTVNEDDNKADDSHELLKGSSRDSISSVSREKKLLKLIKNLRTERTCTLFQVQKEFVKINKYYNKMSFIILEKGLRLKDQILSSVSRESIDTSFLEIINNLFFIMRDTSLSSLKTIEPAKRGLFVEYMIKVTIEWVKLIVDDCVATEQKTFKWCVSALEFAILILQKFNVLLLTNEQFRILKIKVAGCLALLISHFDIMGARSNKADKVLLSISKLQKTVIQRENTLAMHKNTELSEKIAELDRQVTAKMRQYEAIGKVLDDKKSENKFLAYLSSTFSKFSSKWQKGDYLGGGSFGAVYIANDLTNGNVMAVKEVKFPNSQLVTKIGNIVKDEMTVLEMLNHPNIVHYFGVEVHSDKVYLFMEYCEGGSLASLLEQGRIADERLIQWYTFQMVEGLAYLHQNGITHRDVKPGNILLNRLGVIKFIDFGAAKVIASTGRTKSMHPDSPIAAHQTGITGTPMYMSPESITGNNNEVLGSSDVWALGCCVSEMATGRAPWWKLDNEYAIMYHIASGHKPQLPEFGELSKNGVNFIKRCFEIRPEKRATAAELINDPWLAEIRALQVGYESNASSSDLSETN